mgnify:CR=1 FL=1
MTSVDLGMPAAPPPVLAERRKTRQIKVGKVLVGGDAPISVQSMTTTVTSDVNTTLQQIAELTASGCDIVRVACPSQDDADALPEIAQHSQIPVIADIHFQPKYVFAAIDAGCAAVRVNPGNIKKFDDKVGEIARAVGPADQTNVYGFGDEATVPIEPERERLAPAASIRAAAPSLLVVREVSPKVAERMELARRALQEVTAGAVKSEWSSTYSPTPRRSARWRSTRAARRLRRASTPGACPGGGDCGEVDGPTLDRYATPEPFADDVDIGKRRQHLHQPPPSEPAPSPTCRPASPCSRRPRRRTRA